MLDLNPQETRLENTKLMLALKTHGAQRDNTDLASGTHGMRGLCRA